MNIFNIGPMELLLILVVVLIVFGPNKIPEVGAAIGKSLRQFREASKELTEELDLEELNPSTLADVLENMAEEAEKQAGTSPAPAEAEKTEVSEAPAASQPPAEAPAEEAGAQEPPSAAGEQPEAVEASAQEPPPAAQEQAEGTSPAKGLEPVALPAGEFSTNYESPENGIVG